MVICLIWCVIPCSFPWRYTRQTCLRRAPRRIPAASFGSGTRGRGTLAGEQGNRHPSRRRMRTQSIHLLVDVRGERGLRARASGRKALAQPESVFAVALRATAIEAKPIASFANKLDSAARRRIHSRARSNASAALHSTAASGALDYADAQPCACTLHSSSRPPYHP